MLEGKNVEVYHAGGNLIDQGTVEAVTNDGLVLWLRQNGPLVGDWSNVIQKRKCSASLTRPMQHHVGLSFLVVRGNS